MNLIRRSLTWTERGKEAVYTSEDGRVRLIWLCPPNRRKSGDEYRLEGDGRLLTKGYGVRQVLALVNELTEDIRSCCECGRLTFEQGLKGTFECVECCFRIGDLQDGYKRGMRAVKRVDLAYKLAERVKAEGPTVLLPYLARMKKPKRALVLSPRQPHEDEIVEIQGT